jgi:hypothetical protein
VVSPIDTTPNRAEVVPGKMLIVNANTPFSRIVDGDTTSWTAVDPLANAEITIKLLRPVTVESLGIWLTVDDGDGLAVVKDATFLADGKTVLNTTLEKRRGQQKLALKAPVTFRELTLKVLSVYPLEKEWGSIGEIEAFDAEGKNVLLTPPAGG